MFIPTELKIIPIVAGDAFANISKWGSYLSYYFKIIIMLGLLIVTFQNCSQDEGARSRSFVVKKEVDNNVLITDEEINDNISELPENSGFGDVVDGAENSGSSIVSSRVCFQEYITAFSWLNPNADLMNEKPILGTKKLATIKLNKNAYSTVPTTWGWSVEGSIKPSVDGDSTVTSIRFLKANTETLDSLDCYLMRVGKNDTATLSDGLANTFFKNIGQNRAANTLVGFVRYEQQFIACRVSTGNGDVQLRSQGDVDQVLSSSQAFILKRGCHQYTSTAPSPVD
ncbi:MAG: hypothetical protein JNL11_15515 [Bdellovibrionaceae bacterium]|nr:hypothetical protein [Pseudobdellovibrionaceae bacterium]